MDVEKFFHMIGGIGDTSYAKNSSLQKKASDMVKHITIETIQEICIKTTPQSIAIADLGCSSGSNTFSIIKDIIDTIKRSSSKSLEPVKEIRVYLNDLPSNDFNSIFKALPDFYDKLEKERNGDINRCSPSIFIAGYPGSFYGRLFPNNCLHFIYSSYCLHWLSRVPPALYNDEGKSINKGNIYISETSPPEVSQAYFRQYKEDFSFFLRSRSEELVSGGGMVLIFLGTSGLNHLDRGNTFLWQLLSRSLAVLVAQGDIEEERVDSYDVHFYAPCKNEIEDEVKREGSFEMERFEMFEVERDCTNGMSYGRAVSMTVRAIQESMISHHFGEAILDKLFDIYERIIDEEITIDEIKPITFLLVLQKKNDFRIGRNNNV